MYCVYMSVALLCIYSTYILGEGHLMLNEMSNRNVLNILFHVLAFTYLAYFNLLHTIWTCFRAQIFRLSFKAISRSLTKLYCEFSGILDMAFAIWPSHRRM